MYLSLDAKKEQYSYACTMSLETAKPLGNYIYMKGFTLEEIETMIVLEISMTTGLVHSTDTIKGDL